MEKIIVDEDRENYLNIGEDIMNENIRCRELMNWLYMIAKK